MVQRAAEAAERLRSEPWDGRVRPLGAPFEAFPLDEALIWLDANDTAYRAFKAAHPRAFVERASHHFSGRSSGIAAHANFYSREISLQDPDSGRVYEVKLTKTFETLALLSRTSIQKVCDETSLRPVRFEVEDAPPALVTFASAHAWAKTLLGGEAERTGLRFSTEQPTASPTYQFRYSDGRFGQPSASPGFGGVLRIDAATGLLDSIEVGRGRWG